MTFRFFGILFLSFLWLFLLAENSFAQVSQERFDIQYHREQVLILSRLGKMDLALYEAKKIFRHIPHDAETLRYLGIVCFEQKETEQLEAIGLQLQQYHPELPDGPYYLAASAIYRKQYRRAYAILNKLDASRKAFLLSADGPYQLDLAGVAYRTDHWQQATSLYQNLLENNKLDEPNAASARINLKELYRAHLPQVHTSFEWTLFERGFMWRQIGYFQYPIDEANEIAVKYQRDESTLSHSGSLASSQKDRQDGRIIWRRNWFNGWGMELSFGGSETLPAGSAFLSYKVENGPQFKAGVEGNEPARDSLALEALDGRQNSLKAQMTWSFTQHDTIYATTAARQIIIHEHELGQSIDVFYAYEHELLRSMIKVALGTQGRVQAYSRSTDNAHLVDPIATSSATFNEKTPILNGLLLSEINRHGILLKLNSQPFSFFTWEILGGIDYSFVPDAPEFWSKANVTFFPRQSWKIKIEGAYYTSATASNEGESAYQLLVASEYCF